MKIQSNASGASRAELVLFAFDDRAIPLRRGVELHLKGHRAECGRTRIVPPPGDTIEDGNSPAETGYNQLVTRGDRDSIATTGGRACALFSWACAPKMRVYMPFT